MYVQKILTDQCLILAIISLLHFMNDSVLKMKFQFSLFLHVYFSVLSTLCHIQSQTETPILF